MPPKFRELSFVDQLRVCRFLARGEAPNDPDLAAITLETAGSYQTQPRLMTSRSALCCLSLIAMAASVSAMVLTPSANAADGAQYVAKLALSGSNGYLLTVSGSSQGVSLIASRGHSAAVYIAPQGRVTSTEIKASFGGLGDISAHFRPSGRTTYKSLPGICGAAKSRQITQHGSFLGRVVFRGEEGFTDVDVRQVVGQLTTKDSSACRDALPSRQDSYKEALIASSRQPSLEVLSGLSRASTLIFRAGRNALAVMRLFARSGVPLGIEKMGQNPIPFSAFSIEERGSLEIARMVAAKAPADSLMVDEGLTEAVVTPPQPFSGIGTFFRCAKPGWTGSLSVSFPGRSDVRMAGGNDLFGWVAKLKPQSRCPKVG